MSGIGIDTAGTCTDISVYDHKSGEEQIFSTPEEALAAGQQVRRWQRPKPGNEAHWAIWTSKSPYRRSSCPVNSAGGNLGSVITPPLCDRK